jgi:hypothetical protein
MQKLSVELKNTPRNVKSLLVPCSVSSGLNREKALSNQNKVLADNNSEGAQPQHTGGSLKPLVYVFSKGGKPLMPCSCAKAKRLLKKGGAKVIKRSPFTIQLTFDCEEKVQETILGVDTGYKNIGFSAISEKKELISGNILIENRMVKRLEERKMYRRNRRNRLWYRKPRWKNKVSTKKKGWLPPSVERRFLTHIRVIKRINKLLPISKTIVEVGNFDIQKIENPNIEKVQYQQGTMYEYRNRIAYLISREKGVCQYCGKKYQKGNPWRLHHIWGRLKDRPQDWTLVHEGCHERLHKNKEEGLLQKKKAKSYKDSTFMNIIRWRFKEYLSNVEFTYGNITFQNRIDINLNKSHINDSFVIAGGTLQKRILPFELRQKKRHNRSIQTNRKRYKRSIKRHIYKIQPLDLIWVEGKEYTVKGALNRGNYVRCVDNTGNVLDIKTKLVDKVFKIGSLSWKNKGGKAFICQLKQTASC